MAAVYHMRMVCVSTELCRPNDIAADLILVVRPTSSNVIEELADTLFLIGPTSEGNKGISALTLIFCSPLHPYHQWMYCTCKKTCCIIGDFDNVSHFYLLSINRY